MNPEINDRIDNIVLRRHFEYDSGSPNIESAQRVADGLRRVINSRYSDDLPAETKEALKKAELTRFGILAWMAEFFHRKGKLPPFRVIRGGHYVPRGSQPPDYDPDPDDGEPNPVDIVEA
jgi:hypothetical protein